MKILFDFFPILLFFIAYKAFDIYTATAVAIGACILQVALSWLKNHRVESMHLVTLALITVFGGATLILQDELYIKLKPTILNWLFGLAFLVSHFIGKKPLIQRMMGRAISIPQNIWYRLSLMWVIFFFAIGVLNLFVMYNFDTDTWVNFKLFGMIGITFTFVIIQSIYIARFVKHDQTEEKN